jgi:hypothetical protein
MQRWFRVLLASAVMMPVVACSGTSQGGLPGSSKGPAEARYATAAELASAMRSRQVEDGSVSFSFKISGSDGEGLVGSGEFAMRRDGTDVHERVESAGRTSSTGEIIFLGPYVYYRSGAPDGGASLRGGRKAGWQKRAVGSAGAPSPGVDEIWLTRLDEVCEVFTLTGSSSTAVDGRPAVEYRLTADYVDAAEKASARLRLPVATRESSVPVPFVLTMIVGDDARLQRASWAVTADGKTTTTEYSFGQWGSSPSIVAPPGG